MTPDWKTAAALLAAALAGVCPSPAVTLDAPGHVAVEGRMVAASGGKPGSAWRLADWRGRPIAAPDARGTFSADGSATLPGLPAGYYVMLGDAASNRIATLAVVPEPSSRLLDRDSFYGVDSAQSWLAGKGAFHCPWNGGDTYRTVSDLIRLAGIPHVRDRLGWREVEREPGRLNLGRYGRNADLLRERGILVSDMFHDAPKWAGVLKKTPADLVVVHDFCSRVAAAFGDRVGDWEFWNEEDLHFAPEPVWDYAAALKAAYLGFKAARPDMPVLPGALCQPPDSPYAAALLRNDAAKFGDVFNYHLYEPLSRNRRRLAALRSLLERHGIAGRAIWITEGGTNLEGHSKRPGGGKGAGAHSPEQELVVAEFYPKSQIALQMAGVARGYFFLFGAYNEAGGAKDWGVMRRDGTVKPVFSAISTMTRELVSARLDGEINVGDGLRAYLFSQPGGCQTVAFWSESQVDTAADGPVPPEPDFARALRLAAPDGAYRLSDICGACSTATAAGGTLVLEATRYPTYVSGPLGLVADIPALPRGSPMPYVPAADEDLSVVVRAEFDRDDFEIANQKTLAVMKGDEGRVRVIVWNLGETSKTGIVEAAGARLRGLPDAPVSLGPRGSGPVAFDCVLSSADGDPGEGALVLAGVFNGRRSSRLYAPYLLEKRYFASLERHPLKWRDLGRWKRNTTAQEYRVSWDENENAVRFDVAWTDRHTDRWFYPIYELALPEESLAGARMVEFEVKSAMDKVENDYTFTNFMFVYGGKAREDGVRPYPAPIGEWERRRVKLGDGDASGDVTAFRIGGNPKGRRLTFWVRDVSILK